MAYVNLHQRLDVKGENIFEFGQSQVAENKNLGSSEEHQGWTRVSPGRQSTYHEK